MIFSPGEKKNVERISIPRCGSLVFHFENTIFLVGFVPQFVKKYIAYGSRHRVKHVKVDIQTGYTQSGELILNLKKELLRLTHALFSLISDL